MMEFLAMFHSAWTVVLFITFIGIIAWSFGSKRKKRFEDAGRSLVDDDDSVFIDKK